MEEADQIIDIGPLAGIHGGEIVAIGTLAELKKDPKSLTGRYLTGAENIDIPARRRKWNQFIKVKGARQNNLKGFDVSFPLHVLTVVTGVSGTGQVGSVTVQEGTSVLVTGVFATGAVGTAAVTAGAVVNLTGVKTVVRLNKQNVWGLVDTAQTPNWTKVLVPQGVDG
jgi:excinuclease UvrABC ATPase subunit